MNKPSDTFEIELADKAEAILAENVSDPLYIANKLKALGFKKAAILLEELLSGHVSVPIERSGFRCAFLQTEVVTPCSLGGCAYWIDREDTYNCLLSHFRHRNGSEELSISEIADVLVCSPQEVSQIFDQALMHLRQNIIGLPQGARDLTPTFEFLKTEAVCCRCGKPTPENRKSILKIPELGLAYCSLNCRVQKSPGTIILENRFRTDIVDILEWALENFSNVTALEQALGMNSYAIQQNVRQFLGKEALSRFPGDEAPEALSPVDTIRALESYALFSSN